MLSGETLERERNCMREAKGKLLWEKLGREREREREEREREREREREISKCVPLEKISGMAIVFLCFLCVCLFA